MPFDKDGPMGDVGGPMPEDPIEVMRKLSRQGIFVHEPEFYTPMHPRSAGKMRITAPFWGGAALMIDTTGDIDIGQFCFFDDFVFVYTHIHQWASNVRFYEPKALPKKIGAYVYLAPRVTITGSCEEIGEGVLVTEGSVVTGNLEPYSIYSGHPAARVGANAVPDEWKALLKAMFAEERATAHPDVPAAAAPMSSTELADVYEKAVAERVKKLEKGE